MISNDRLHQYALSLSLSLCLNSFTHTLLQVELYLYSHSQLFHSHIITSGAVPLFPFWPFMVCPWDELYLITVPSSIGGQDWPGSPLNNLTIPRSCATSFFCHPVKTRVAVITELLWLSGGQSLMMIIVWRDTTPFVWETPDFLSDAVPPTYDGSVFLPWRREQVPFETSVTIQQTVRRHITRSVCSRTKCYGQHADRQDSTCTCVMGVLSLTSQRTQHVSITRTVRVPLFTEHTNTLCEKDAVDVADDEVEQCG